MRGSRVPAGYRRGRIASSGPAVASPLGAAPRAGARAVPRPCWRPPSSRAGRARGEDELLVEGRCVWRTRARSCRRPPPASWGAVHVLTYRRRVARDGRALSSLLPPSCARGLMCRPCRRCRRCCHPRRGRHRPLVPSRPVRRHRRPVAREGHRGADRVVGAVATRRSALRRLGGSARPSWKRPRGVPRSAWVWAGASACLLWYGFGARCRFFPFRCRQCGRCRLCPLPSVPRWRSRGCPRPWVGRCGRRCRCGPRALCRDPRRMGRHSRGGFAWGSSVVGMGDRPGPR